jgi:flagellar biosynthesis protein FlhA
MAFVAQKVSSETKKKEADNQLRRAEEEKRALQDNKASIKETLRPSDVELLLGKQLWTRFLVSQEELTNRVGKMRRNFAKLYGFIVPEIRLADDLQVKPKGYQIRIHGTIVVSEELRLGQQMIVVGNGRMPDLPGEEARDPAFGIKALWIADALVEEARRQRFNPIDPMSVLLTHLGEVLRNNLSQLLSYKDVRQLLEKLDPEYRKLLDEIVPNFVSNSSLQSVLKLLLAERVSIRNLEMILEAIAEVAPFARRPEAIVEHVRVRIAPQICGELAVDGVLSVLRLGNRWDLFFHEHLKRDAKGDIVGLDADPAQIERFSQETVAAIQKFSDQGEIFAIVTTPDARPFVRLIVGRLYPAQPVLSHLEIACGVQLRSLGTIS